METEESKPKTFSEKACNRLDNLFSRFQFNSFSVVCTSLFLIFSLLTILVIIISSIVIPIYRTTDKTYRHIAIYTKMFPW